MRILIAEDDAETGEFVRRGLREFGHNPVIVPNGADALHLLLTEEFDLAVVDRMLPGIDGVALVQSARAAKVETPILMLTALGGIQDRVEGLDSGADDYLIKPFAFSELVARINALARRKPLQAETTRLTHGGIALDLLKRTVQRDGRSISLQPREFQILEELVREGGNVVTRTMLLERVWDYHFDPMTNIVDTHVSRLRSKLNEDGLPDAIETVRGVGYRMADVA